MPDQKPDLRLVDIQQRVGGELHGSPDIVVSGVSSLEEAGPQDLAYVASDRYIPAALKSHAGAFITHRPIPELDRPHLAILHPSYVFAKLSQECFTTPYAPRGIADQIVRGLESEIGPDASIWPFVTIGDRAKIGARVTLYPGVFIGSDVSVGDDTVLFPNVAVLDRCRIGARVRIHSGAVIGSDGFGYVQHGGRHQKIPQLGIVVIEDDVELGANVTIDRATYGRTVVKRGTKVDNLVQIAHNVTVGEDSILVAQVGIAGSTTLGRHVMIGGQAGVGDHLKIGDLTMIAARSGVSHNLQGGQVVSGNPAMAHATSLKSLTVLPRLPQLREHVRDLERRVRALESRTNDVRQSVRGKKAKKKS